MGLCPVSVVPRTVTTHVTFEQVCLAAGFSLRRVHQPGPGGARGKTRESGPYVSLKVSDHAV